MADARHPGEVAVGSGRDPGSRDPEPEGYARTDTVGRSEIGADELGRALASSEHGRRAEAIARTRSEPAAEPLLIVALDDPDPSVRLAATRALAGLALPRGIRALCRASVQDVSRAVRKEAVAGIGRILATRWSGSGFRPST